MTSSILRDRARPVVAGVSAGAGSAFVLLGADALLGTGTDLVTTGNVRALLGSTFAAVVTIGAFAFWMRLLAVQLAASTVPPRTVATHLHDRFQRRVIAAAVGALAFEAVVILSLPSSSRDPAPLVASLVGALLGVGAIAALLIAIEAADRSTRPSVVISESAGETIARVRAAAGGADRVPASAPPDEAATAVVAPSSGWVRSIDVRGLTEQLPDGALARVDADVGTFVVEGWTPVVRVWGRPPVDTDLLAARIDVGARRDGDIDVTGSLARFADIAVQAATGGSSAPSVVYESLWYLGAVLHELVRHQVTGVPTSEAQDGATVLTRRTDTAELVELAVDRIRRVTASSPELALELVRVLLDVRVAAELHGRDAVVDVLDHQADLTVEQCRHAGGLNEDVRRVVQARHPDRSDDAPGTRREEYEAPSDQLDR